MEQHLTYLAQPKTYYYFRPYNMVHIQRQQQLALDLGQDSAAPYDNTIFTTVFDDMEKESENKFLIQPAVDGPVVDGPVVEETAKKSVQ